MASRSGATSSGDLFDWLRSKDPALAQVVQDGCFDYLLQSESSDSGVTLLLPNQEARQEIISLASVDSDAAAKLFKSFVIPESLHKSGEFRDHEIGNLAGYALSIKSTAPGVVHGDTFTLTKARDSPDKGDFAVWMLTKGRLPLTGNRFTQGKHTPRRRLRQGGAEASGAAVLNRRQILATQVEGEFATCMQSDMCKTRNPYLSKIVSLIAFIKANNPELFITIMPVMDYDPVPTFYLLIEPYKTTGDYLIPEEVLFGEGRWNGADAYGNPVEDYKGFFREIFSTQQQSATDKATGKTVVPFMFRDRAAIAAQIDSVRSRIKADTGSRQKLPQYISDAYTALVTTNSIGGMGPVMPDSALTALAGPKKLFQDEFRFFVHTMLQTIRKGYQQSEFASLIQFIRDHPGNNYSQETILANPEDMQANVAPRAESVILATFLDSTDFLYMPVAPDMVGAAAGAGPSNPSVGGVWNRNRSAMDALSKTQASAASVSPAVMQELTSYVSIHGKLPPEVSALVGM
jgi:hypothetical protein